MGFLKKNFHKVFLITILIFISYIYSAHWIYPLLKFGNSYLPIEYSANRNYADSPLYYTLVNNIKNGYLLINDPSIKGYEKYLTIYTSYNFSLLIGAISSIFLSEIDKIYYFNTIFFPSLNFFFIYIFFNFFIKDYFYSVILATLTLLLPNFFDTKLFFNFFLLNNLENNNLLELVNQILRFPNIQITNFILLAYLLIFILYFKKKFFKIIFFFFNFFIVFTSFQCFLIICFFNFFYFVFYYYKIYKSQINTIKKFIFLIIESFFLKDKFFFILLPLIIGIFFYLFIFNYFYFSTHLFFTAPDLRNDISTMWVKTYNYNFYFLIKNLFYFILLIFLNIFIKKNKIFIIILLSIYTPYTLLFLLGYSDDFSDRILFRGAGLLIQIVVYINIYQILILKYNYGKFFRKKIIKLFFLFFLVFIVSIHCFNQYVVFKKNKNYYSDNLSKNKSFKDLYSWIALSFDDKKNFLIFDPYLNINLPIYAKVYVYIPQLYINASDFQNRVERLMFISKLYGVDDHLYYKLFLDENNFFLIKYLLYYNRDIYDKSLVMFHKKIFENKYSSLNLNEQIINSYDYFVTSDFDRNLMSKNSLASRIVNENKLVFENKLYKVYSMKEKK